MPQRRTAKKELRKNKKRRQENLIKKHALKSAVKGFKKSLKDPAAVSVKDTLKTLQKSLDKAASNKIIHPNKAAKQKSRFSKLAQKLSATPTS